MTYWSSLYCSICCHARRLRWMKNVEDRGSLVAGKLGTWIGVATSLPWEDPFQSFQERNARVGVKRDAFHGTCVIQGPGPLSHSRHQ